MTSPDQQATPTSSTPTSPDQQAGQQASSTPTSTSSNTDQHTDPAPRCEGCGGGENVAPFEWQRGGWDMYCSACRVSSRLYEMACYDLHARAWPALVAWAGRWAAAGLTPAQVASALEKYGAYWHPDGAYARPDEGTEPSGQAAAQLLREAGQQASAAPTSAAPLSPDQQAAPLSPDQRRNMAARRAEIAATLARCAADLEQMDALERAALG